MANNWNSTSTVAAYTGTNTVATVTSIGVIGKAIASTSVKYRAIPVAGRRLLGQLYPRYK